MIEVSRRGWYNPELDYRDYMIPGILVQLVTMVGHAPHRDEHRAGKGIGHARSAERDAGNALDFIAAKLLPLWSLGMLELAMGLTLARWCSTFPMRGSLAIVFLAAAYLVAALGVGLWVSTVVETTAGDVCDVRDPDVYLLMSGLFTPVRGMPHWAQYAAYFNPVMHFTQLMRAVLLKGAGFVDVSQQLGVLAVSGAVVLTLAVRQYRKRAD